MLKVIPAITALLMMMVPLAHRVEGHHATVWQANGQATQSEQNFAIPLDHGHDGPCLMCNLPCPYLSSFGFIQRNIPIDEINVSQSPTALTVLLVQGKKSRAPPK